MKHQLARWSPTRPNTYESLLEFIPRTTPRWDAPFHLKPYIDVLETAPGAGLRLVFAAPPQHGKTETTLHAIALWLKRWPHFRYAYATYSHERSLRVGRRARALAERAGVALDVANMGLWQTPQDGQVLWTSVGGGMTGEPVDGVLLIDDPLKDRQQAESANIRELHKDWFHGVVEPRCHPGASIIVMATRWHNDDLSGYLVKHQGYRYINLKAIAEEDRPAGDNRQVGEALWPQKRPLSFLQERQRANVWNFASLFQGSPRPRGGAIFREPTYYSQLPTRGFKVLYGCDFAYTESTHADWSVCVELWVVPPLRDGDKPVVYVVNVDRKQVDAPAFALTLKARQSARAGKMFWIASGTEKGVGSFMRRAGIPLVIRDTKGRDKLTRSMATAELWNLGCIQVPIDTLHNPWVEPFVDEVTNFSGVKDPADDQVDALVAGADEALRLDDLTLHYVPGRHS